MGCVDSPSDLKSMVTILKAKKNNLHWSSIFKIKYFLIIVILAVICEMDSVAFEKQAEKNPRKWSDHTWCMLVKPTSFFKFRGEKL